MKIVSNDAPTVDLHTPQKGFIQLYYFWTIKKKRRDDNQKRDKTKQNKNRKNVSQLKCRTCLVSSVQKFRERYPSDTWKLKISLVNYRFSTS